MIPGNVRGAKQLIQHVLEWHPDLLDAKCQMIELERRAGNQEEVSRLFEKYLKSASSPAEYSSISMKYARFLHKVSSFSVTAYIFVSLPIFVVAFL